MSPPATPMPRATLRLQFHQGFTLDHALPLVPYFAGLGLSHLYASPLLCARAGSMHGYDVVDPTRVNPELRGGTGTAGGCAAPARHGPDPGYRLQPHGGGRQ